MVKFFVRTTGERALDESFSQIKYELLIDKEHKPIDSFIKQLKMIDDYDAVLLEDDVILCKNFQKEIENVIEEHKDEVINFYTKPSAFFSSHFCQQFIYNQCTYYPKGSAKKIAIQMEKEWDAAKSIKDYDVLENEAIHSLNMYIFNYRPCLVQHKDGYSLIGGRFCCIADRITPYFKDYLDRYGIDYNNPGDVLANLDKLNQEKEELIKQIKEDAKK
ncbi:MAG: hypothetical protein KIG63_00255 [Methanobrevibacter sp.]|nr:hypothetical protein [Methanobrevibacter sp.]